MNNNQVTWFDSSLNDVIKMMPVVEGNGLVAGRVTDKLLVEDVLQKFHSAVNPRNVFKSVHDPDNSLVSYNSIIRRSKVYKVTQVKFFIFFLNCNKITVTTFRTKA